MGQASRTLTTSIKLFCTVHLFYHHCYEIRDTFGPSMLPTLNIAGDWCLIDKLRYSFGRNLKVGDLVMAGKPGQPETSVLKRIIGMVSILESQSRNTEYAWLILFP